MRLISRVLVLLLCLALLAVPVLAQNAATTVRTVAYVSANGACQVSLSVTVRLDSPASKLTFPLPANAKNVTLSGASVRTYQSPDDPNVQLADLSGMDGLIGEFPMSFQFTLPNVLRTEKDEKTGVSSLMMEIPLLCGFTYPVSALEFDITMPGDVSGKPSFLSGVQQTSIESIVDWNVGGSKITGSVTQALSDRETLTLRMAVSEEMFPGKLIIARDGNPEAIPMAVCAAAALLYWLLLMRCPPIFRQRQTVPLDGVTAGELGCRLTMAGADLSMMVLTWARFGYLRIVPDKYGRVLLYRRMEMGNERTEFENRVFRALFAKGNRVDATGGAYAKLCLKTAGTVSGVREMHARHAGSERLFRAIACGVSLFAGVCLAMNMTASQTWQVLLSVLLGALGVVTAWAIQSGMYRLHIRGKLPVLVGLGAFLLWLALGAAAGQFLIVLVSALVQVLAGIAAAYGGRRSELGRYQAGQILYLRSYLKRLPKADIERGTEQNPDYFFELLPYAVALGVDMQFARRFGDTPIPACTYLTMRQDRRRSAAEWALLVHKTADRMDKLQRRMSISRWLPVTVRR